MASLADLPVSAPLAVPADRRHPLAAKLPPLIISHTWLLALSESQNIVNTSPLRKAHVSLQSQTASIGTTALPLLTVEPGIWRISIMARIRVPSGGTSGLIVTISWTCRTVGQSEPTTNLTGNTTITRTDPAEATLIIRSDADQPISYSTTYATTGSPVMTYDLDVIAEQLAADAV